MNEIILYQTENNQTEVEVRFDGETVWLSQTQLAELFQRDRSVITKHINNIFKERELEEKSNVQKMHIANSDKPVTYYNLDVIISVGYRIKSKQGTQFRIWATQRLKEHLVQGYSINQKRLNELQQTVQLLSQKAEQKELDINEAKGLLEIISQYTQVTLALLVAQSDPQEKELMVKLITQLINSR